MLADKFTDEIGCASSLSRNEKVGQFFTGCPAKDTNFDDSTQNLPGMIDFQSGEGGEEEDD